MTVDIKEPVIMIIQNPKNFCLLTATHGLAIYNYEGKLMSTPKIPGVKCKKIKNEKKFKFFRNFLSFFLWFSDDQLNRKKISISPDVIAVIDSTNNKVLKMFDVLTGKPMGTTIEHGNEIIEFELNNCELSSERKIAFLDNNRELFISPILRKDIVSKIPLQSPSAPLGKILNFLEKNCDYVRLLQMALVSRHARRRC